MTWDEGLVNDLFDAVKVLSEVLNNTLDLSKFQDNKVDFNFSFESLEKIISQSLNIIKQKAMSKRLKIEVTNQEIFPKLLEVDKARLFPHFEYLTKSSSSNLLYNIK